MNCFLLTPVSCLCLTAVVSVQSDKLIKELESKCGALQQRIAETELLLKNTKKDVGDQLNGLVALTGQIEEKRRYIIAMNNGVEAVSREISGLERQLRGFQRDLKDKKKKYESLAQYLYKNKSVEKKPMFIFSAKSLGQTYRCLCYVRECATYQRLQGKETLKKQEQVNRKKKELQQVKVAKENLLREREGEKVKLEAQKKEKRETTASLQKKQKGLQSEISRKRREANQLNAEIDKLIAEEIERVRKRAKEEVCREAAACRKTAAKKDKISSTRSGTAPAEKRAASLERFTMSKVDRELLGNSVNNRDKLPMPITGPYITTSRYEQYAVGGLRNVKLDNRGIDIQGKLDAQARATFDGKAAAVSQLNGLFNILTRHGDYIPVYCNLSFASVKSGDTATTKQAVGPIPSDGSDNGRTVLHLQLRRERDKLNPEPWSNR